MKKLLAILVAILILFLSIRMVVEKRSFHLLTTLENETLIPYIDAFCRQNDIRLTVTYMGDIDAMKELSVNNEPYDAVWLSNSIWLYQLDSAAKITDSKAIGIVPIVVGIKPELYCDSIKTIQDLREIPGTFGIPSVTGADAGASSYLGIYYSFSGSPRMLTMEQASDPLIREQVLAYVQDSGETYSGYQELVDLVREGKSQYYYGYESDFIRLNNEYGMSLKLLYLGDGIALADKPLAYVDHQNDRKKAIFLGMQKHLLTNSTQRDMCQQGIRTGYGGLVPYADEMVFNPEWGIDIERYLAPMNYPAKEVITDLLNFYVLAGQPSS